MSDRSNVLAFPGAARETSSGRRLIPERISEARAAKRLNQTQLAEAVGVTRQSISYFENGARSPDPETMMRIAESLGQPLAYFTTPAPPKFGRRTVNFFRKQGPDTKRRNSACDQFAEWFACIAYLFTEQINFPEVRLPNFEPSGKSGSAQRYSDEEIETLALAAREHFGLGLGPISNAVRLLETNGVLVGRLRLKDENVGAFSYWSGDRPFIFMASDRGSAARARYDVCHELGHLVLHRWVTREEVEDRERLKELEREADYFAGAFLMPEASFAKEVYSPRLSGFIDLKRRWKVSIQAMVYRCKNVGIFDDDQAVNLYKQISYKKWRISEPLDGPNGLELEEPLLLRRVAELILQENRLKRDELLATVNLNPRIVEALTGLPVGSLSDISLSEESSVF